MPTSDYIFNQSETDLLAGYVGISESDMQDVINQSDSSARSTHTRLALLKLLLLINQ